MDIARIRQQNGRKKEMERAKRRLTALDNRKQELKTMAQMDEKLQVRSRLLKTQLAQMRIRASVSGIALTHDSARGLCIY